VVEGKRLLRGPMPQRGLGGIGDEGQGEQEEVRQVVEARGGREGVGGRGHLLQRSRRQRPAVEKEEEEEEEEQEEPREEEEDQEEEVAAGGDTRAVWLRGPSQLP